MLRTVLAPIKDDTEEAPWMVMGMPQSDATANLYVVLRDYARALDPPLLVAAMLPIRFRPNPPDSRVEQLAPDIMAAAVSTAPRDSYDVEEEGIAPCFVLEVISPASRRRDTHVKPARYERMGVNEYALFWPARRSRRATLSGYRRDPEAPAFVAWQSDEHGRLWSEELRLWLAIREEELHLQREDGSWLPTYDEIEAERLAEQAARDAAEAGWRRAMAAQEQERSMREREQAARVAAEAEVARLRAELERSDAGR